MKFLLLIPLVLLLVAGGCYGSAKVMGGNGHGRELIAAAVICAIAGDLAMLPIVLLRKSKDAAVVAQAGLGGTVIHMLLTLILAAAMWSQMEVAGRKSFLFLLLAFFWVSLIVLVLAMVRLVRGAAAVEKN